MRDAADRALTRPRRRGFAALAAVTLLAAIGVAALAPILPPKARSGDVPAGEFADPIADFVEHGAFRESFPGRHQANRRDAMLVGFCGRFADRLGINETVARRTGLIKGRLRTELAILRATAGFGVDDGAEVNLVSFEVFPDPIGPGHQVKDVRCSFQFKQPPGFVASEVAALQDPLAKLAQAFVSRHHVK